MKGTTIIQPNCDGYHALFDKARAKQDLIITLGQITTRGEGGQVFINHVKGCTGCREHFVARLLWYIQEQGALVMSEVLLAALLSAAGFPNVLEFLIKFTAYNVARNEAEAAEKKD